MKAKELQTKAVTLIELLTVIAITGLLMTLVAVAIQRSREAGRRLMCANNLKQIGIALHSYQSLQGVYPANSIGRGVEMYGYSIFARLLPHLEMNDIFNSINFSVPQDFESDPLSRQSVMNMTSQSQVITSFLCPSDPNGLVGRWMFTSRPMGGTNYRTNGGIRLHRTLNEPREWSDTGAFGAGLWLAPHDFRDGLACTVALSERLRGDDDPFAFSQKADMWYVGGASPPPGSDMADICSTAFPSPLPKHYSRSGYSWFLSGKLDTWYEHILTPNHRATDCSPYDEFEWYSHRFGTSTARSYHSDGVNCLMMDGAVRFIPASIDRAVWHAIATRARGETVDAQMF